MLRRLDLVASSLSVILISATLATSGAPATATAAEGADVRISEVSAAGPGGSSDDFIEIANFGDAPADLDGWEIYRCANTGSRAAAEQVPALDGVTLEPGETYVAAHELATFDNADVYYSVSLNNDGAGAWLQDGAGELVDSVAFYPEWTDSECALGQQVLPSTLDARRGQTYQRVGLTGVLTSDFVKAARTPGAENATEPDPGVQPSDVLISELTNGGPAGSSDNFIEVANFGDEPVDVSNWGIYRCTADGQRHTSTLQVTIPDGTTIWPGETFVAAHDSVVLPDGVPHERYDVSLANAGFGALIENAEGDVMDAAGVYEPNVLSACDQGTSLPNRLDYGWNETYQRFQNTGDNSADFAMAERTVGELLVPEPGPEDDQFEFGPVRISELAHSGPEGRVDNFFELANYGDEPVSLDGWTVNRCQADGRRNATPQIPVIDDVTLAPGETYLAVREGSAPHREGDYDAVYGTSFADTGFGLIVFDADGDVVDSVGAYDETLIPYSPCTKGLSLINMADTDGGESYQRLDSTGSDAKDHIPAPRTPGELADDLRAPADVPAEDLEPVEVAPHPRPLQPELVGPAGTVDGSEAELEIQAGHTAGDDLDVTFYGAPAIAIDEKATRVYAGATAEAPPAKRHVPGEKRVRNPDEQLVTESTEGFPFQRYEMKLPRDVDGPSVDVAWNGRSTGSNEVHLHAWNRNDKVWDLLDAEAGLDGGTISLRGSVDETEHVRGSTFDVLVIDGPATGDAFTDAAAEPNEEFKDPAEYDFSFAYLTDTQFLSEGGRSVYADMNAWIAANSAARKIEYAFHTGDIVQRWLNGWHPLERAHDEFEFASDVMAILETAGVAHGVVPGNHDNKWGRDNDLYNEYFPPSRYAGQPWFGESWRPGDNQNHYDVMEISGAKFLMLYLGYFSEDAIPWANDVIAAHPDHNVIVGTHDYLTPDGSLSDPGLDQFNRWTSLGQTFWDELILPNENVFLVLSGHHHGVAMNIHRDGERAVVEMLANYQNYERDGRRDAGFLRLLQIDVDSKTMAANTYSPTLEEHNAWEYDPEQRYTDVDDEFIVEIDIKDEYAKRVETTAIVVQEPVELLGTRTVADGEVTSVTWDELDDDTEHIWHVESVDSLGRTVRSPFWSFATT